MDFTIFLDGFMDMIGEDPRIGPSHISLYLAILCSYKNQQSRMPVSAYKRDLVKQAKMSSRTYHKCMSDLQGYGYIRYTPSYNPVLGSLIYLLKIEK